EVRWLNKSIRSQKSSASPMCNCPASCTIESRSLKQEEEAMQQDSEYQFLGKGRKAIDGVEKITGRARYAGDVSLPGMLHARPVLSPYAPAKIVSIDTAAARQMPGVTAVLAAGDLSTKDRAINSRHSAVLARDKVYFRGQPVVVGVAERRQPA